MASPRLGFRSLVLPGSVERIDGYTPRGAWGFSFAQVAQVAKPHRCSLGGLGDDKTYTSLYRCIGFVALRLLPSPTPLDLGLLSNKALTRDDESDPGGRIYRGDDGEIYHSVTRILGATSASKEALQAWKDRLGPALAAQEAGVAAERGTRAHGAAEYVLRTARKVAERHARVRHCRKVCPDGLWRGPAPLTAWALGRVAPSAPRCGISAQGYARGLVGWVVANVTAIHAIEFGVHHPLGFAGTCDGLVDVGGVLTLVDWKTSARKRGPELLLDYRDQLGAYSLGLKHILGLVVPQGAIVVARRVGTPDVTLLSRQEMDEAEARYEERVWQYWDALGTAQTMLT